MKQGLLAFQYEEEKSTTGMTALSGLMTYVELMHVAGLRSSVERRVGLRGGGQGWTDSQIITSLILLNLAGGESVVDLEVLEKDAGLCRVLRHAETHGMRRRERRALKARWRGERWRSVPSDSVVFRYLERFHDAGEEAKREAHRAFIPSPNDAALPQIAQLPHKSRACLKSLAEPLAHAGRRSATDGQYSPLSTTLRM